MRIVSWNIQWGKGRDGRIDLGRIVDTARALGDPDVLCLQEVAQNYPVLDDGKGEDQPARFAALLPGYRPIFHPAIETLVPGAERRFGNMVLTRLPVVQVLSHLLPRPVEAAKHMQRQALELILAAPFGPVRVVTTHLEYHSAAHRLAQVARLRALHEEAAGHAALGVTRGAADGPYETLARPAAALLCGDFNFEPDWPDYAAMTAPFATGAPALRDAWTVAHAGRRHEPTCGIDDPEQWPKGPHARDFFFVSADLAPRVAAVRVDTATPASDHQPVLLELRDG
jgi:endonuclease/exonuclease/phosphatase family metal-dependent hydrolase